MELDIQSLTAAIAEIRASAGKYSTNCVENIAALILNDEDVIRCGNALVIIRHEYRVDRLLYFSADSADLLDAFGRLPKGEYYIDVVSRSVPELHESFLEGGISCVAEMQRLSVRDVSAVFEDTSAVSCYRNAVAAEKAELSEAQAVYDFLWDKFDTGVSHLSDIDTIRSSISGGEFTVYRGSDGIVSLLQAVVKPRSFYINQIVNGAEKAVIHSMLLERLREYCDNGGKYAFAWVDKANAASMKFHAKYGMTHDGLCNYVYRLTV